MDAAYVGPDNHSGARSAVQHVVSVHEPASVAFVGGSPAGSPFIERLSGIQEGLTRAGRRPESITTMPCTVSRHDAHAAAIDLLDGVPELPLAVFAYNDVVALGVASATRERGLTIGRDVLLVGFDDIEAARYEQPPLSTVHIGVTEMGRAAAELLVAIIDGDDTEIERTTIPSFVVRGSCGCDVDNFADEVR